ncbi:HNH endonuclease [Prevotella sp. 10(H)]|uniref:HNH endonuclease n=1 Tax=Prevotella sp. 10(H) TaxID=1158294 RepID=UPI00068BD29D|nr:HNH endonuclease [Prevotella sp. 10(H)]
MEQLKKELKTKYNSIRYSNLINRKNKQWWFTISPNSFRGILHLMLIDKQLNRITILEINIEKELKSIIPRKEGVYLSGQYDLYFLQHNEDSLNMRYLTDEGYMEKEISNNILEIIEKDYEIPQKEIFIETIQDLKDNLLTIEAYIGDDFSTQEREFALSLIQKGKNLIAYKVQDEWHFAPSRFIGYKDNDMQKHLDNDTKDGKETTPVIEKLAKQKLNYDPKIEEAYIKYCELLDIEVYQNKRQYWFFDFSGTPFEKLANNNGKEYKEGRILEGKHKRRERNRKLVANAKRKFRDTHDGKIFCEICGFNFMDKYGIDYIEVHHLKAIMDMEEDHGTSLDNVCLVCPNCHRVIHSQYPFLVIDKVIELMNQKR